MSHSQKVKVTGLLLLAVMSIGMFAFTPLSAFWTHIVMPDAASSLPYHEFADGPYSVKGNTIVGTDGNSIFFMVLDVTAWSLTAVVTAFLMPLTLHLWVLVPADLVVPTGMQIQCDYQSRKASGCMDMPRRRIVPLRTTRRLLRIQLITSLL